MTQPPSRARLQQALLLQIFRDDQHASSTLVFSLWIWISGFSGASYGALTPVNSLISPALAFLYRPLGSRFSASSTGISTKTSMKGRGSSVFWVRACSSRASWRSALYGEMKEVRARVVESAKSLATWQSDIHQHPGAIASRWVGGWHYLRYAPDVLLAVFGREAQVFVQAEAHVVAVETVGGQAEVEEVLLEGGRDGRLAGGRQAGEPDGGALLLAELTALLATETVVPGDVAVDGSVSDSLLIV
ncbi:V-type proton ATPase subunit C [Teratosphaeria destructans]|uniref:V-type proton ATPase subunit C n=1 Tax=Teratosphaeria destructans TaxID=418781 RepID=A0A9W7SR92_9PEZI|nr:V-type proton ATPase subunit C [Teratosphaeria destructans]